MSLRIAGPAPAMALLFLALDSPDAWSGEIPGTACQPPLVCSSTASSSGKGFVGDEEVFEVVVGEGEFLGTISLKIYGTTRRWTEIAAWNSLDPPYVLSVGQRLVLRDEPDLDEARGALAVLDMWRERLQVAPLSEIKPDSPGTVDSPTSLEVVPALESGAGKTLTDWNPLADDGYLEFARPAVGAPEPPLGDVVEASPARAADGEVLSPAVRYLDSARRHLLASQPDEALKDIRAARESEPGYIQAWYLEIRTLRDLHRGWEAEEVRKAALKINPDWKDNPLFERKKHEAAFPDQL